MFDKIAYNELIYFSIIYSLISYFRRREDKILNQRGHKKERGEISRKFQTTEVALKKTIRKKFAKINIYM